MFNAFASASRAATALAQGGVVILEDPRLGTGDLVAAARLVTAAAINLMATHARGLTELALSSERISLLDLPPMVSGWEPQRKPFAVSIEARRQVSTGISAADRATTIRTAVAPGARPHDLVSPGHVFPLRVRPGALDHTAGRAEGALALALYAGCGEGAVLSQILDDEGELATDAALAAVARTLHAPRITIGALVEQLAGCAPASMPATAAASGRVRVRATRELRR